MKRPFTGGELFGPETPAAPPSVASELCGALTDAQGVMSDASRRRLEWEAYFGRSVGVDDSLFAPRPGHDAYGPQGFGLNITQHACRLPQFARTDRCPIQ